MANGDRKANWQGMNWCRPQTRLAIYLRDGLACCWCRASVEEGTQLTLDHCKPHSKGGNNSPTNLVTCCKKCNSSRQDRPMAVFARAVADYVNADEKAILKHVNNCRKRELPRKEANEIIARRGSVATALAEMQD